MKVTVFVMMRLLAYVVLFRALAASAGAQVEPAAGELLNAVAGQYGSVKSFHFEAVEVTRTQSGSFDRTTRNRVVTALDSAGRSRVEFDDGTTGGVTVYNGETTWVYLPHLKKYSMFSGMALEGSDLAKTRGLDFAEVAQRYTSRYRGSNEGLLAATVVRDETVEIGGESVECKLVEARYRPAQGVADGKILRTFCIDPESKLIRREQAVASMTPPNLDRPVEVRQVIEFRRAVADEDLPDALFAFEPPPGVEEVGSGELTKPASRSLVGAAAPDFTLQGLDGRKVALKDLRGQVVVLDFWATWCGPCRIDMPRIEALHNELKDKGLHVFGINGEDPKVARGYLERNGYTFPTLSDPGMEVSRLYDVTAIPTAVVIDREGKIRAHMLGSGTKERLREVIRAAGLE